MKAPSPPGVYKTAEAQAGSNQSTAITQQLMNMVDQQGPNGSLTYNQTGTNTYFDPLLKKDVTLPKFTATTALSPEQQALLGKNNQFDLKTADIALGQADRLGSTLSQPFSYDVGDHEKWASDLYGKLNNDVNARNISGMEAKLANQGLQPGTPAYDDAMRNLMYSQDKARNDFMLGSYGQGFQTAKAVRDQPINETTALMSGAQVTPFQPQQTPNVGVNGVDVAAIANNKYNAQMANYGANMGGLFNLAGGIGKGLFALSDRRAKKNISEVGKLKDGTKLYTYEYKSEVGGKRGLMHLGVMAQQAEKKHPDAVMTGADGLKRVDYGRLVEALS